MCIVIHENYIVYYIVYDYIIYYNVPFNKRKKNYTFQIVNVTYDQKKNNNNNNQVTFTLLMLVQLLFY